MSAGKILLPIFIILCLLNLWGEFQHSTTIIFFTKPLLITTLAIWFFMETKAKRSFFSKMIIGALVFSIGGDTLLMFVENGTRSEQYFLMGLGSFLIAHLFYIIAFLKYPSENRGLLRRQPWLGLPLGLYFLGIIFYLIPDLPKALAIPVVLYSVVIMVMVLSALNTSGKIPYNLFIILFAGVLFFMVSDTLIALNKFKSAQLSLPQIRLWIMPTYLIGQFLIVKACLKMNDLIPEQ